MDSINNNNNERGAPSFYNKNNYLVIIDFIQTKIMPEEDKRSDFAQTDIIPLYNDPWYETYQPDWYNGYYHGFR